MIPTGDLTTGGSSTDDDSDDGGLPLTGSYTPPSTDSSEFYDAPDDPESQEDDVVTYEDVADPTEVDSQASYDAITDDPNTNDTVDATTTMNPDNGPSITNTGGSGDDADFQATEDVVDPTEFNDDQTDQEDAGGQGQTDSVGSGSGILGSPAVLAVGALAGAAVLFGGGS